MSTVDEQALADIAQIARTYARGMDRQQTAMVASLFTEQGRLALYDGEPEVGRLTAEWRGREAITAALTQGRAKYSVTTHFLGQQTLTLQGDGCTGETYCLAHHLYDRDEGTFNRVMSIRYHDLYVRHDGRWLIEERRLAVDWIEYRPVGSPALAPH
jgi:hypothetical protein